MQSKLNRSIKRIFPGDYQNLPRRNLKAGKYDIRKKWSEVEGFYRRNFDGPTPDRLAELYEPLYQNHGRYRLPLVEFKELVGKPRDIVTKGAPLHSTVCISQWGLQFEFPEMHLIRDVGLAYNTALKLKREISEIEEQNPSWSKAKEQKEELAEKLSEMKYSMRMSLICCFNLVEAYINGIAWEYVTSKDISELSENKKKLLEGDQTNILDKLVKIPKIIMGTDSSPVDKDNPPLSEFRDVVKPYRDSSVHASPYSAPEKFGGYDRLSKIYDLDWETVKKAVDLSLEIISRIHKFIGNDNEYPDWVLARKSDGFFQVW